MEYHRDQYGHLNEYLPGDRFKRRRVASECLLPMLFMSIAALSGHLTLGAGFPWIGTYPALVTFAVATRA